MKRVEADLHDVNVILLMQIWFKIQEKLLAKLLLITRAESKYSQKRKAN